MNFSNAKIYKLVSNLTHDIYIGSTTKLLTTRLSYHKSPHNKAISRTLFNTIGGIINIELLENYPCNNINELKAREYHYITTNKCINKNKPFISSYNYMTKEWHIDYRNKHLLESKKYRDTHLDKMKQYQLIYQHRPEYIAIRKEYGKMYYINNKIIQQTKRLFEALPFHQVLQ